MDTGLRACRLFVFPAAISPQSPQQTLPTAPLPCAMCCCHCHGAATAGMVHVDGLRLLLGAEPTEVHCMGIHGTQVETPAAPAATPAAPTEPGSQTTEAAQPPPAGRLQQWFTGAMDTMNASGPAGASELGVCSAVTLSLRMSTGALATISLDRVGGSAMQTVLVVGELAKAEFRVAPAGGLGREEDLQKVGGKFGGGGVGGGRVTDMLLHRLAFSGQLCTPAPVSATLLAMLTQRCTWSLSPLPPSHSASAHT